MGPRIEWGKASLTAIEVASELLLDSILPATAVGFVQTAGRAVVVHEASPTIDMKAVRPMNHHSGQQSGGGRFLYLISPYGFRG